MVVCIRKLFVLPLLNLIYEFMKLMCFLMHIKVVIFVLQMLLFVATPITFVLGRETFQTMSYTDTLSIIRIKNCVLSILILKMDAPIYFATVRYLRER